MSKPITVISLEQALALPYATQRMVHMGWRVIRLETPAEEGGGNAGDPNRYIGADLGYHDLHSYYIAPNIGKEAITINLKKKEGQELLLRLIKELEVDVFLCNTLPKRYKQLGIDFETLSKANPKLIWCSISAMGPKYPDAAGYDPALQSLMGYTFLTGETNGKPVPCGIPIIDLKAGDEAFTQVLQALLEQRDNANGKEIHVSMAQCAASWLITALPQLSFVQSDSELFQRSGNEHRSFIPCNVYQTKDGMVYLAIGNDIQWAKFTSQPGFESLASDKRKTNAGRMLEKDKLYIEIGELTKNFTTAAFVDHCRKLSLSVAPVNTIKDVAQLEFIQPAMLQTTLPNGKDVSLFPPAGDTEFLKKNKNHLPCSPRLGENNAEIFQEAGIEENELSRLKNENTI
ncbi:MAG: CoA transferase [Crocinitomicaceae bacterium]|nr:CoA transferase [Crocinitomicaceae bacterium]MBK8925491.1 CoA transferase [Crocinitomicaceae bacterium]